jgi:hypothetical protein
MRKGWKKEKEKEFLRRWAGGIFGLVKRSARAREGTGPAAAQGRETTRARGSDGITAGPTRQRERRGQTAPRVDAAGEPVVRGGRNPTTGGLGGDSPPVTRFLDHGEGLANLGVGSIWLEGAGRGAVRVEVAELRGGDRRRWAVGEGLGAGK